MITGLIQAIVILVAEARVQLAATPPELRTEETKRQISLLETELSSIKRERARLDDALDGRNR